MKTKNETGIQKRSWTLGMVSFFSNRFQLSSRSIMFVLSRTVWVRNSLFITVEDKMFSLMKISDNLCKPWWCVLSDHNSALSLSVSACSCVQIEINLFVLPMHEELQPGQMNSYTTFYWLNCCVLSLVLAKKRNFVFFSFIRTSPFGVYLGVRTCELFLRFIATVRIRVYYVDFFVFFVLRHWWVSQALTPRQSPHLGWRDIAEAYV